MNKNEARRRRDRIALTIVLAIPFILLLFIGILIIRIVQMNKSPRDVLQSVQNASSSSVSEISEAAPTPAAVATPTPTAESTPTPEPEPTPEPTPEQFFRAADSELIEIEKHPGGELSDAGRNLMFISYASGADTIEWRFVSPDYTREIVWNDPALQDEFPGLHCEDGDTDTLIVYAVPKEINGWYVVCLFTDSEGGKLASEGAQIVINGIG